MQHEHETQHKHQQPSIIVRHIPLLLVGALILAGIYWYFQTTSSVMAGAILLVLAHLAAVVLIFFMGRGLLTKLMRKVHGVSDTDTHSHDNLATEGATISWPSLYDLLVKVIFLGKEQQFREGVVELAHIQSGEKVLDVGCGTGTFAIIAKEKGGADVEVIATDAAPEMIAKARQEALKKGVNVDFQTGLAEKIDFPDATFDVVMNSFMVHHLPSDLKARAFAEMHRVLKPGGRLLVVDFEPPQGGLKWFILRMLLGNGMMQIDNHTVPPLLEEAGFASVKSGSAGHSLATYMSGRKAS